MPVFLKECFFLGDKVTALQANALHTGSLLAWGLILLQRKSSKPSFKNVEKNAANFLSLEEN